MIFLSGSRRKRVYTACFLFQPLPNLFPPSELPLSLGGAWFLAILSNKRILGALQFFPAGGEGRSG